LIFNKNKNMASSVSEKEYGCENYCDCINSNQDELYSFDELTAVRDGDNVKTTLYCPTCIDAADTNVICFFCEVYIVKNAHYYRYAQQAVCVCMACMYVSVFSDEKTRDIVKRYFSDQRTDDDERYIKALIDIMVRRRELNEMIKREEPMDAIGLEISTSHNAAYATLIIDEFVSTIDPKKREEVCRILRKRYESKVLFFASILNKNKED
jgi:hypothetical protein